MPLSRHFCPKCRSDFDDEDELWEHAEELEDHHPCRECREVFDEYEELKEHNREEHTYYTDCQRHFQSESNLRHHLNSKLDRPADLRCPGGCTTKSFVSHAAFIRHIDSGTCLSRMAREQLNRPVVRADTNNYGTNPDRLLTGPPDLRCPCGCTKSFVSHAAFIRHIDSGTCLSRMAREQLNRPVVRADTNNYVTKPDRLLTGPLGHYVPPAPAQTWATQRSWNGEAYECFLCHSTFDTLARLNHHLQSPRHEDKTYRCPKSDCATQFVTLSGLIQHVESGSCGVRMFRQVRDVMDGLTRG